MSHDKWKPGFRPEPKSSSSCSLTAYGNKLSKFFLRTNTVKFSHIQHVVCRDLPSCQALVDLSLQPSSNNNELGGESWLYSEKNAVFVAS